MTETRWRHKQYSMTSYIIETTLEINGVCRGSYIIVIIDEQLTNDSRSVTTFSKGT